eukprot:TRINITY_DN13334_c0_g1_i1.p1 TRINITY_DN13334_c0_g1~~TRINITY_DN13334_c0_g1_i1.p1  ORF type:complete len:175 (-),score=21.04 TRINITY_DN13334_c0_g1_i1:357-881(-)
MGVLEELKCNIGHYNVSVFVDHLAPCFGAKLISKYCELDSRVKSMSRFILHWADSRRIINPSKGYFSSYAIELMVIFFLQLQTDCILPSLQTYSKQRQKPNMVLIPSFEEIIKAPQKSSYRKKIQFDFAFDSINIEEVKANLGLPQNTECVAILIIKFFYYFSVDYPVRYIVFL